LRALALDPEVRFVSFGSFDRVIWAEIMEKRHGFPPIPIERWIDIQATCSYLALPRSLDKVLPVVGAEARKSAAGRRQTLSLSRPNRKTGAYPELTAEALENVRTYNEGDVLGAAELHDLIGDLPEAERRVWELDQQVNQRGIGIDIGFVQGALAIAKASTEALVAEFTALTRGPDKAFPDGLVPSQVEKTREWLRGRGCSLPDLTEETIAEALEGIFPDDVRRVLQIRQITASSSVKKFDAMLACVNADGRVRGTLLYHGASTGRWSGALVQPQNLPRPTFEIGDPEALVAAVKSGDPEALRPWGEQPLDVLAGSLRLAIVAHEGSLLGIGDFSLIEACVLLALAGQHDKCDLIANGADPYRDVAASIHGLDRKAFLAIPESELTIEQAEQRRIGKNTILGAGFGMGAETFRSRYLKHLPRDEAVKLAEQIVMTYRRAWAPRVPLLWRDLERTAGRAIAHPGMMARAACGIAYRFEQRALPVLTCRLLNGKLLHYQDAQVSEEPGLYGPKWSYHAYRRGQWRKIEPWGGQLTENVVQALARELLVAAMFRFEEHDHRIVVHIHDEVVVESSDITTERIVEIMSEKPAWAERLGIPVRVKAWTGKRYGK
jgi:DNA polymerase